MRALLLEKRSKKSLTQAEVADQAHISRTAYSNIENGTRRPSPEVAKKLSEVLDIPWTRFFEEDE